MTFPTGSRFKDLLALGHDLADRSGAVIRPHFRRPIAVANKAGKAAFDPVTKADQAAERAIARMIRTRAPEHGVVGEEYGREREDAPFQWVVDPIDGTRSFITGTPMWGTLIGLLYDGAPVLGLMDQPFTGERFWSAEKAAYAREAGRAARRIRTRSCERVADALIMTTSPDLFESGAETDGFARVKREARMTRYGGDCYAYCLLASGFVDLVIEAGLKSYDIVALIPIVERAGGRVTTWDGGPPTAGGRIIASGDPALHERALKLLNR
ncbi:histidinol-phosphatase [Hyphomicrobium sp.]|uniref:histidinol-phosphatase n=1 Tax=Hyphomicrobium sp. TaxID=82 RepID=UPI0025C71B19|nr:histidinol-phosphatase [Hyphomicrobium sp.]MCC7251994.1 histidinol-phosphatase [Hyphomicrobium sp.]